MSDIKQSLRLMFDNIYKGNKEAAELSMRLWDMSQTLDDLVDGDPVKESDIHSFAMGALFELQRYQLYNSCGLAHHVLGVYLRWRDANSIEADKKRTEDDLNKCYMLRAGIYDIFVVIAYYLYGETWAASIGPSVRRFYGESLTTYKSEIGYAKSNTGRSSGVSSGRPARGAVSSKRGGKKRGATS